MIIQKLAIDRIRNLKVQGLTLSPGFNLFYGKNASGKTSVLEAISILFTGKSFRAREIKKLIAHDFNDSWITADLVKQDHPHKKEVGRTDSIDFLNTETAQKLSVQRSRNGSSKISLSLETLKGFSEAAKLLPLMVLAPDLPVLIDTNANGRRQYLDWIVFHVKPSFQNSWKHYRFALRNRNSLLKNRAINNIELEYWEKILAEEGHKITEMRQEVLSNLMCDVKELIEEFSDFTLSEEELYVSFEPGWGKLKRDDCKDLLEQFSEQRLKDQQYGYTTAGPHKADLIFSYRGKKAQDVLSRGQRKWVSYCLKIAQVKHLDLMCQKKSLILIDDFGSELDKKYQFFLLKMLKFLGSQVIITAIDKESFEFNVEEADVKSYSSKIELKMFHVEQGRLTEITPKETVTTSP